MHVADHSHHLLLSLRMSGRNTTSYLHDLHRDTFALTLPTYANVGHFFCFPVLVLIYLFYLLLMFYCSLLLLVN